MDIVESAGLGLDHMVSNLLEDYVGFGDVAFLPEVGCCFVSCNGSPGDQVLHGHLGKSFS